jgi:acyl-ACP thioesterase
VRRRCFPLCRLQTGDRRRGCTDPPKRQFKLADYPFRLTDNVRYGDLDPNKHVNNGVYSTYFETARVTLLRSGDSA